MDTIITLNNIKYCAFCGKPISKDNDGQFLCTCPDATNYRKALHQKTLLQIQAAEIMNTAPKPKFHAVTIIAPINEHTPYLPDDSDWVPSNPL